MKIFIISSVRDATTEYKKKLEKYVEKLEAQGHEVYLPHRDTNQKAYSDEFPNRTGLDICYDNLKSILKANRVDIFFKSSSKGSHFDMGQLFAIDYLFEKDIKVVENEEYDGGKSFARMLDEWQEYQRN